MTSTPRGRLDEGSTGISVLRDYAVTLTQPTLSFPFSERDGDASSRFDEVVSPEGALRSSWKGMASTAVSFTAPELARVEQEITRSLADDGATYVRPGQGPHPWRLDPMPLILDAPTWARLDLGLAQRAELLNAVVADLYGPQRLLSEGVIPSAAVFGHPGFIRAIARPSAVEHTPLVLTATDLGRDGDGEWRVLADRVQAPSGLGYAMENRRVIARLLPELYQDAELHLLDPYYAAVRDALLQCAPGETDPRIVVLSPGTHSETAYDQAFLANMLGFPLVQGSDLIMQSGSVWIKPAGWPKTAPTDLVHVILRRVDADWCDPLELRSGSQLGIAGLTEAVRRGRVRVVNGLGAGVVENPALLPFMSDACERLLGEQLRLPSTPAFWCGDAAGRSEVLRRLTKDPASLILRKIDGAPVDVDKTGPDEIRARIDAHPYRYVGLDRLPLSQAPVWHTAGIARPRPLIFRAFTMRHGSVYRPLAGGMASIRDEDNAPLSKDVWVLKAAPDDLDQGLSVSDPRTFMPSIPTLAPRTLEDLFWAGRYAERAEDMLRLVLAAHAQHERRRPAAEGVSALIDALQQLAGTRSTPLVDELRSLITDADRAGSAAASLRALRTALEGVRDQLSSDTWRVFGITDRAMDAARRSTHRPQIAESAERMLTGILSLQGVTANMIRDTGWHMIEAGRYLERSLQLCTLLASTTTTRPSSAVATREVLDGVLLASESVVTHRRRYRGYGRTPSVLTLLLLDHENPRSLAFCLDQLQVHLAALPDSTGSTRPERLRHDLADALEATTIPRLSAVTDGRRLALVDYLDQTRTALRKLGVAIEDLHFAGGPPSQPLASLSFTEMSVHP